MKSTTRFPSARQQWRTIQLSVCLAALAFAGSARASFHTWIIAEIYSSADGSVQFIELRENQNSGSQNSLNGRVITCTSSLGTHTYTFSGNAFSSATANKTFLIGTSNLVSTPGGVKPDYIFTNAVPFLFANNGTVNFAGVDSVNYTNLPADGRGGMIRSGASMVVVATNSPKNFNAVSNSIVPTKFVSVAPAGGDLVLVFVTATGTNGTTGPNYAVQANGDLTTTNWNTVSNVTGNGTLKSVAIPIVPGTNRFFRLRVP